MKNETTSPLCLCVLHTFRRQRTPARLHLAAAVLAFMHVLGGPAKANSNPPAVTTFSNTAPITILDNAHANPYPSTITVSGWSGTVSSLTVDLFDLSHTFGSDLDVLLVGPTGAKSVLFAERGNGSNLNAVDLRIATGGAAIPTGGMVPSATYAPAGTEFSGGSPAPAGPYTADLTVFNGLNPNGTWSLFIVDDSADDDGTLFGGWALNFTRGAAPPAATHWLGQTNGNWSGANWASNAGGSATTAVPTSANDVTFSATGAGNKSTTLDQDFTIKSLTIADTVSLSGSKTLTVTGNTSVNSGALTLNSGITMVNNASGQINGSTTPKVTVTGANAKWNMTGSLTVGSSSKGALDVLDGGAVTVGAGSSDYLIVGEGGSSEGTITVSGADSTLDVTAYTVIGFEGKGTLNVENGGVVTTGTSMSIGYLDGSVGLVNVTGAGSKLTINKELVLDGGGSGTLNILNGGEVSNEKALLATSTALFAAVTVDGTGSKWTSSGNVTIGVSGPATVNLQNGGVVDVNGGAGKVTLGERAGGTGTLNIGSGTTPGTAGTLNAAEVFGGAGTAVLNFNQTNAVTFVPKISGSTKVSQLGSGKTILTAANTYTGGTIINTGILQTENTSALGSGAVTVNGGALRAIGTLDVSELTWNGGNLALAPVEGDVINVAGAFTNGGGGGIFAIGPQDLVQNKAYDLVTFDSTNFVLGDFKAISTNANIQYNSSFILNKGDVQIIIISAEGSGNQLHNIDNGVPTFANYTTSGNVISGLTEKGFQELQTFVKDLFVPNSNLNVPGPNTLNVTGNTTVNDSTVNVNGTMNVGGNFNDPNSVINVSGLLNVAGNTVIEGASTVNVNPGGIFLTSGNTTFNDSTANIAGTYRTGGDFNSTGSRLNVSGLLIVDRIADLNAGTVLDISSGGRVEVGTGTFIHGGARAIVNGVLQSPVVSVLHGGTLQGNGLVIGNVLNRGTVAPGNSIGTLTIDGNYTQFHNGTLQIELSGSRSDLLVVSGTAKLAGTLDVRRLGGKLEYGDQHTFLQAGRIIGEFDRIQMPQPGTYRGRFLTDGGTGILLVAPTSYTLVAETANQRRLAKALDKWIGMEDGDIGEVTLALDVQTEEQYPAAFDAISPAYYSVLPRVSIEETISQNQLLGQRMSALRAGARGVSVSGMPQPVTPLPSTKNPKNVGKEPMFAQAEDDRWGAFVQVSGQFAELESFQSLANHEFDSASASAGMDYRVTDQLTLGLSAGYGYTEMDYDAGNDATLEDGRLTGYASYDLGRGFWLQGTVGGAISDYEVERPVRFSFIDRTAQGETEGHQFYTSVEAGKDIQAGNWTISPSTGLQFTHLSVDGFTETGAGALNLGVAEFEADSYRFHAGVQVSYQARLMEGVQASPYAYASWQHEFSDQSADIRAALSGAGTFDWKTDGDSRDRMQAGVGCVFALGTTASVNVGYQADFGADDYHSHLVFVQGSMRF